VLGSSFSDSNEIKISRPKTAIILAAGKTTPVLSALFGKTSSAMIPVNGRPIIHWSVRYLREFGIERVVVGAREEDDRLSRLMAQCFPEAPFCELVFIKEDRGAGYSLLCCLKSLPLTEPVLVVLGDTLFQFPTGSDEFFSSSFVMVSPVEDSLRWCLAEVDAAQRVLGLIDKPADNPNQWPALIGVYYLDKPAAAHNRLAELAAIQNNKTLQLSDALAPYVVVP
jgi:dTDP-glucose pyrophosphorylase